MANLSVEVKRVINAPIRRVYDAWVDPEQLKQWHSPENFTVPVARSDHRKGGKYYIKMLAPDGTANIVEGEYLVVEPLKRLVFSWGWHESNMNPTQVTVNFKELEPNKTELILLHEHFTDQKYADSHKEGWDGTFNNLQRLLSAPDKGGS